MDRLYGDPGISYEAYEKLKHENERLRFSLAEIMDAAEFGNMEQSPPGYWDNQITKAKEALSNKD